RCLSSLLQYLVQAPADDRGVARAQAGWRKDQQSLLRTPGIDLDARTTGAQLLQQGGGAHLRGLAIKFHFHHGHPALLGIVDDPGREPAQMRQRRDKAFGYPAQPIVAPAIALLEEEPQGSQGADDLLLARLAGSRDA